MKIDLAICEAQHVTGLVNRHVRNGTPYDAVISIEHPGATFFTDKNGISAAAQGRAPRLGEEIGPEWRERQLILVCWDVEFKINDAILPPDKKIVTDALDFVRARMAHSGDPMSVLLHCRAARSRSTGLGLVLLHEINELEPIAALEELLRIRPIASPNLAIVRHATGGEKLAEAVLAHPAIGPRRAMHVGQNPAIKVRPRGLEFGG